MSTTALGLTNDYGSLDTLPASDVNALANALEAAVANGQSVSIAGTGDITLASTEYATGMLVLTGVLTGNRNVIFPTHTGRRWIVFNNTSGAFSVTLKTAAGTGPTVVQGKKALVYCDGTDIVTGPNDLSAPVVRTGLYDSNGNELLLATATASAVNELTLANASTGNGPVLEATGGDTNIDVTVRGKGSGGVQLSRSGGKLGFFGATLASRAAALTQTYATADRTLSAYTPDSESGAYTGAADGEAKLADLNALRVAVENLRALAEDTAQFLNAVVDDLQTYGLEQ